MENMDLISNEMAEMGMVKTVKRVMAVDVARVVREINQAVIDAIFDMTADQESAWWAELDATVQRVCE